MNLNFGHGIFIFYLFFASILFYQVYKSTTVDHSLVAANYYEQDLAFQHTLDARNRGVNLPVVLQQMDDRSIQIQFLGDEIPSTANLHLMRPDSKMADVEMELSNLEKANTINTPQQLIPGRWLGRIEWTEDGERVVKDYKLYLN